LAERKDAMARKKNQIAGRLGQKIRAIRRQKKITLVELSKLTGIAQATLSRMETGLMLGTVKSHQKIAEMLGLSLAQLYEGFDSRCERVSHQNSSSERKVSSKNDQMKCELLTQELSKKKMMPLLVTLNAHGKTERVQLDRGVEKFLFVLDGTVNAILDQKEYPLNVNDTLYFDASIPHQLVNTAGKHAKIFCSVSNTRL
jgi:transcriptional regulator with XRE-family HTH domain